MADEPMVPIDEPMTGDQVAEVNLPASANANSPYAWPKERKILSTRVNRIDGPLKVSGRAKYSYDVKRPGLLYARILRSPHPHARITSIDLAPALAMKGVKAAVTIAKPGGKVMYVGDEVAAVAAATEDQARDAARAIKVEYEVLPFLASSSRRCGPRRRRCSRAAT